MLLYHHTDRSYLPSIFEKGLLARPWYGGVRGTPAGLLLSAVLHHRDVVWLTTQPTALASETDKAWARRLGLDDALADGKYWLHRSNGDTARLAVNIPKHSKRLHHFRTWVKKHEAVIVLEDGSCRCNDAGELLTTASFIPKQLPSSVHWYVHFGDVPPKRIEEAGSA